MKDFKREFVFDIVLNIAMGFNLEFKSAEKKYRVRWPKSRFIYLNKDIKRNVFKNGKFNKESHDILEVKIITFLKLIFKVDKVDKLIAEMKKYYEKNPECLNQIFFDVNLIVRFPNMLENNSDEAKVEVIDHNFNFRDLILICQKNYFYQHKEYADKIKNKKKGFEHLKENVDDGSEYVVITESKE